MEDEVTPPDEEQEETFGQMVRKARIAHNFSQRKLADFIKCSPLSVMRWEAGKTFPRTQEIQQSLIEVLEFPEDFFDKLKQKQVSQRISPEEEEDREDQMFKDVHELKGPKDIIYVKSDNPLYPLLLARFPSYFEIPPPNINELIEEREWKIRELLEERAQRRVVYRGIDTVGSTLTVGKGTVTANGKPLGFKGYYSGWKTGPTDLHAWGYRGEGARQLAGAILYHYFETMFWHMRDEVLHSWATSYEAHFKDDFVIWFRKSGWQIWSGAITAWLKEEIEKGDYYRGSFSSATSWRDRWDYYEDM